MLLRGEQNNGTESLRRTTYLLEVISQNYYPKNLVRILENEFKNFRRFQSSYLPTSGINHQV